MLTLKNIFSRQFFSKSVVPTVFKIGDLVEHYKGGVYQIKGYAMHTETEERLVIYTSLDSNAQTWARPQKMFEDKLQFNGHERPRFTKNWMMRVDIAKQVFINQIKT
jgi:hypothetical protein